MSRHHTKIFCISHHHALASLLFCFSSTCNLFPWFCSSFHFVRKEMIESGLPACFCLLMLVLGRAGCTQKLNVLWFLLTASGTGGAVIKPTGCLRGVFAHILSKNYDNSRDWSALCFTEKINELKQAIIVLFFFNRSFYFLFFLF